MASRTYHHNKKTGVTYVYSVQSYWDREKKAPRNKQVCIGKLNKETGEVIPSAKKHKIAEDSTTIHGLTANARIAGPFILLEKLVKQTGLAGILKHCFPELHSEILSLVYFIVQKGLPLSRSEPWSNGHLHPSGERLVSQRISELLLKITEADRQKFLSLWLRKITERDYLCYDITSISSYARSNEYIRYGYNRDGEALPQINLAMLFGQKSRLPAYYRRMPGNITDVATLKTTMKQMDFIGANAIHFVLDRGFYSETNIDEILARRHHFTMAVPTGRKWVENIIDRHYESIALPKYYHQINETESLYAATSLYKWGEDKRRTYLHIYYNAQQAAEGFDKFTRELLQYKQELESGKKVKFHEEHYERFFTVKETPKRGLSVSFNDAAIQKYRKRYAGFFCILSTSVKEPMEALRIYRAKDVVENSFDDLKNQLDMKRLRMHSSAAMDSRMFLQFIALIFICQIRNTIQDDKTLRNLTVREVIENMETMVQITYSGRYGRLYTETSPIQRKIIEAFGLTIPK
ncbi:MAG: IS1634 family transposase [Candidatus Delongbacteria bacterium]|nr:IS1634 family transposase [Candidatus Delongbacteria bacterium]